MKKLVRKQYAHPQVRLMYTSTKN